MGRGARTRQLGATGGRDEGDGGSMTSPVCYHSDPWTTSLRAEVRRASPGRTNVPLSLLPRRERVCCSASPAPPRRRRRSHAPSLPRPPPPPSPKASGSASARRLPPWHPSFPSLSSRTSTSSACLGRRRARAALARAWPDDARPHPLSFSPLSLPLGSCPRPRSPSRAASTRPSTSRSSLPRRAAWPRAVADGFLPAVLRRAPALALLLTDDLGRSRASGSSTPSGTSLSSSFQSGSHPILLRLSPFHPILPTPHPHPPSSIIPKADLHVRRGAATDHLLGPVPDPRQPGDAPRPRPRVQR